MSYSITVTVKDGTAHSVISGPAPDGTYRVDGHIDDQREDVGVARSTAAGQLASRSSATVYKGV